MKRKKYKQNNLFDSKYSNKSMNGIKIIKHRKQIRNKNQEINFINNVYPSKMLKDNFQ